MRILETIWSLFARNRQPDADGRVKCGLCRNKILVDTADGNGGLCGVCFKKKNPRQKPEANKPSDYHAKLNTPVDELTDKERKLQLTGAITWKNEARIDEMLSSGTDLISKSPSYSKHTWLGHAIDADCGIPILEKLLAAGCDVNSCSKESASYRIGALDRAISKDRIDVVKWLLDNGADPNLGRPIIGAINHGKPANVQLEMLKLLLGAGADVNKTFDLFGDESQRFTVLDWAEMYGISSAVIELLKTYGANKQWTDDETRKHQNDLEHRRIVP
jgi:hypothetical protein